MRRHTNFARVANHRLLLLRLAPSSARLALRNSAYRRTSSKSLSVKPPVADVSAVTRESSEVRLGKNVAIGTEKKRDKLSRSSGVGLYLPVSHLDTVFAATFSLAASASWLNPISMRNCRILWPMYSYRLVMHALLLWDSVVPL